MIRRAGIPRIDLGAEPSVAVQATIDLSLTAVVTLCAGMSVQRLPAQSVETTPNVTEIARRIQPSTEVGGEIPPDFDPSFGSKTADRSRRGLSVTYGPYTRHTGKGNHNCHPHFTGVEWPGRGRWAYGGSHFVNSFSQRCWFAHASRCFT